MDHEIGDWVIDLLINESSIVNYNENTMKYNDMQFENLAYRAIRSEFPNSTNAIRPADRLDNASWVFMMHQER